MKQISKAAGVSGVAAAVVLAFLVSGCASSSDSVADSPARTARPSATASPKPTPPATFAPPAVVEYKVLSAKLAARELKIAVMGPQGADFQVRQGSQIVSCNTQPRDILPSSFPEYIVTCAEMSNDKKLTLLTHLKGGGFEYRSEKPLVVTS